MIDALEFAANLARETGSLLLEYYNKPSTQKTYKKDRTLLTEADLAADRKISKAIHENFPGDHILSEELNTSYPGPELPTWIIDPLDGTTNFSQGLHYWGVSIARVVEGRLDTAALYFPPLDELYAAQYGQGATLNGRPLKTRTLDSQPISFFTCDSRIGRRYTADIKFKPRILGSAAYNFCAVARSISAIGFESIPKIWDIAASWLVLTEAGGACKSMGEALFPLKTAQNFEAVNLPTLGALNEDVLAQAAAKIHLNPA